MPLKSLYKGLCYAGILSLIAFGICQVALVTDNSGLNFDFGIWVDVFVTVIFILIFASFLLPLFYIKRNSKKLFFVTLITVIIAMIVPGSILWESIAKWLQPKPAFNLSGIFGKTSEFRTNINSIQSAIINSWFILQFVILLLTFIIRKLKLKTLNT